MLQRTICLLITCPWIFMQQDGDIYYGMLGPIPFHYHFCRNIITCSTCYIFLIYCLKSSSPWIMFSIFFSPSPFPSSHFLTQLLPSRPPINCSSGHTWTPSLRTALLFPETQNSDYTLKIVFSDSGQMYPNHFEERNFFFNFDLILNYAYKL